MATEVDICNMALAYLGDRATLSSINPPEGSDHADHCARFYPIARAQILSEFPWAFASKRARLARLATEVAGGLNSFALPQDCLKLISVHDDNATESEHIQEYALESFNGYTIVNCEPESVYVKYVATSVEESVFPAIFCDALAHLLASKLAGVVITGTTGIKVAQEEIKFYRAFVAEAMRHDSGQINEHEDYRCPFVGDMTQGGDYGYN